MSGRTANVAAALLGLLWALLFDGLSPVNVALGFIVARVALGALRLGSEDRVEAPGALGDAPPPPPREAVATPRRIALGAWLVTYFLWELILANLGVLRIVLSRRLDIRPGIVAYPLRLRTPFGITCLANMITLTPGTITADVDEAGRTLYIHSIDARSDEAVVGVPRRFEDLLLEVIE